MRGGGAAAIALLLALPTGARAQDDSFLPPLDPGTGRVVFFRSGGLSYAARGCPLIDRAAPDAPRLSLKGGRFVMMSLRPASYRFTTGGDREVMVMLAVGETRYVRCTLSGFPGKARLRGSSAEEFYALSGDLKQQRPD